MFTEKLLSTVQKLKKGAERRFHENPMDNINPLRNTWSYPVYLQFAKSRKARANLPKNIFGGGVSKP
jgi:hypothetical protein